MMKRKVLYSLMFFLLALVVSVVVIGRMLPKANSLLTKEEFQESTKVSFSYVAIGDSLTQGVGDTTDQGGFVPILSQALAVTYDYEMTAQNYGVSGNTSKQILKRMQSTPEIQEALAKAGMMTLTVGGNDVLAVIRKHLADLTVDSFDEPAIAYQERLANIIDLARADNPDLPIYVLGIYNPFYLNFPEMTDMQTIVDNWNTATEEVIATYDKVYFVSINDKLYKGIDGEEGITSQTGEQTTVLNDALFEDDHFHPNNIGYQIMADSVMERINETKDEW